MTSTTSSIVSPCGSPRSRCPADTSNGVMMQPDLWVDYIRRSYKRADSADVSDEQQEAAARALVPAGAPCLVISDSDGHQSGASAERRVRGPLLEDPRRPRRGRGLTMECGLAAFRPVGATGIGVVGVFDVERRCEPRDDQAMSDAASVDRASLPGRATGSSSGRGRSGTTARVHRRTGRQIVRSVDAPARAARSPLDTIVTPPTLRYEHGHGDPDQRRRGGVPARHRAHAGPQTCSVARAPDRSDRPPAAHPPGGPRGVGT